MAGKKTEKRLVIAGFTILLLLIAGSFIFLKPQFTGFVVGPEGQECDGDWVCGDWSACTDGNQTRDCTSENSVNCTSPVTEFQACLLECVENWTCAEWSSCVNETQTRTCEDANECGTEDDKPELTQECVICTENWTCAEWSTCVDSSQTRTCTDSASCGTTANKPEESQSCTMPAVCGDGNCESGEDCYGCPDDCGDCPTNQDEEETTSTEEESTTQVPVTAAATSTEQIEVNVGCISDWACTEWSECVDSSQSRECTDSNACGTDEGKPSLSQSCEVIAKETCFDKIRNQDEKGIDCGGVCEKKCSIFTIAGSAISGPIDSGKQFFQKNKTTGFIVLGILVLGIAGIVTFRFWKKKVIKE